ncbi:MAG: TonB-dependent receptor [Myxococcales bacterium]|nr:TonB-dependent receptor [Myxococcales bacterium]
MVSPHENRARCRAVGAPLAVAALTLTLILMAGSTPSLAAPPSSPDDRLARDHFNAGQRFFNDRRYAAAIAEFLAGYELTRLPLFLHNVAGAYQRLSDTKNALVYYRRFIVADPESPYAAEVRAQIAQLERLEAAPAPVDSKAPLLAAPAEVIVATPAPRRRIWTWAGVGATTALAVPAVVLAILADRDYHEMASSCGRPVGAGCPLSAIDKLRREVGARDGLFIATGILAAATITAVVIESVAHRSRARR